MYRFAQTSKMIYNIPDSQIEKARKAKELFEDLIGLVRFCNNHLDQIREPFDGLTETNGEVLAKEKKLFQRYAGAIRHNFDLVLKKSNRCAILMSEFATDTKVQTMMNSFLSYIDEIEKESKRLLDVFDNFKNPNFPVSLISAIDQIKKTNVQIKELVNDRILEFIDVNILASDRVKDITDENDNRVYDKKPLLVQLYEERINALK